MKEKCTWGGRRQGAGRPSTNRPYTLTIKCAKDVYEILSKCRCKSEHIEKAVRYYNKFFKV